MVTTVSAIGPLLVRAGGDASSVPDVVTAAASAIGLVIVTAGKLSLGRSFGLVPANRGVVGRGMYGFVRHPIYAGYLLTHLAFAIAMPQPWNIAVIVLADSALVARALREERLLGADDAYRSYCQRVVWHFVPGVF
jgi:protein-S-isoprenylcysteine O-methyltransferase Ste14